MPQQITALTPRQQRERKAERVRRILGGAKLNKDESEAELEDEDEPWEWIYGGTAQPEQDASNSSESEVDSETPKKRRRKVMRKPQEMIIAAKKGDFQCKVGDTVLVGNEVGADWVAIISRFFEDEGGEKSAYFMCKNSNSSFAMLTNYN